MGLFCWTCHICNTRIEENSQTKLSAARAKHLAHHHPGEPRGHGLRGKSLCGQHFSAPSC